MTFRYARHTHSLSRLVEFYTRIVGLERLGGFEGHAGYDGVFLGHRHADWHLEFTQSDHPPQQLSDADDLLVFYIDTPEQWQQLLWRLQQAAVPTCVPRNPYWARNGLLVEDPDGFRLIFAPRIAPSTSD